MISRLKGTLVAVAEDRVEVETSGGVVYEVELPLTVRQRLPAAGATLELRTLQVVTESSISLYGFSDEKERALFQRLLSASGVGAKLALAMMSAFTAERLARALVEKDTTALRQVTGVGKKKAERIAVELADKVADLAVHVPAADAGPGVPAAQEAVRALVALGYSFADADRAVRQALEEGDAQSADDLLRKALATR